MRFLEFDFDKLIESVIDHNVWANDVVISAQSPVTINIHAVRRATGMSYQEIKSFLDSKGLSYSGNRITYDALSELKEWYLKKMRRYVRNALVHGLEHGSQTTSSIMTTGGIAAFWAESIGVSSFTYG